MQVNSGLSVFSGNNSYTGTTTISGGTLVAGSATGFSTPTVTLGDANTNLNGSSPMLAVSGAYTIANPITIANQTTTGAYALAGLTANSSTLSGAITANQSFNVAQASGGTISLTGKITGGLSSTTITGVGPGMVVLQPAGASSFAGGLAVNGGSLYLNSAFSTAPAVSVGNGGTFGGTSTVAAVTVASGGAVQAGYNGSGSLSALGLAFQGTGTVNVGTLTNYASTPAISVGATGLSDNGAGSITINVANAAGVGNGSYELIGYSGAIGGTGSGAFQLGTVSGLNTREIALLTYPAGFVDLTIAANYLKWTGAVSSVWDTSTQNWKLNSSGAATAYINSPGDTVAFDDTPPAATRPSTSARATSTPAA